jgi:DNA mismatch repair protein MutL
MGKIIILDENTANKIAAGEVIEKPASVIKELVENSIDAGATAISVEIRNGGISFIRVTDNGSGIAEDDVEIAFERHATSKIRRADDLETISSMGFRGEALASIAAVSHVQLSTRVKDAVQGTAVEIRGGRLMSIEPAGCPTGTSITVRELFFNTPARYKFLKKDSTEAGYVADMLSRIALGYPDISFKLISNNSVVMHTPGNGDLKSTIFSIYGQETSKQLIEVRADDSKVSVSGYIGRPEFSRSNRNQQSFYINRRYIKSKTITSAIEAAYGTFLMKNRYAFAVLDIRINQALVDINVHPSKMEVKFSNEQDIYRAVYHAVNNALLEKSSIRTLPEEKKHKDFFYISERPAVKPSYSQESFEAVRQELERKRAEAISGRAAVSSENTRTASVDTQEAKKDNASDPVNGRNNQQALDEKDNNIVKRDIAGADMNKQASGITEESKIITEKSDAQENTVFMETAAIEYNIHTAAVDQSFGSECFSNLSKNVIETPALEKQTAGNEANSAVKVDVEPDQNVDASKDQQNEKLQDIFQNSRIVGQLFSTYILLEIEDELLLLDQHAAHERIRYEELKRAFEKDEPISQTLLAVIPIELTASEYQFALNEKDFFEKLGFSYDSFGYNSIILRAVPFTDTEVDAKGMFLDVLDYVMSNNGEDRKLVADEALFTMACKSAVKAHMKLDEREIHELLSRLASLVNPYTCPHGRPAILKLRRYELEKLFKRIV